MIIYACLMSSFMHRQRIKEHLTYLVPTSVHFMDETFMNSVVVDAVTYLINNGQYILVICYVFRTVYTLVGTLIHYNSPALSDLYFIDPQWLYDLLASVVTMDYGSSYMWDRGDVLFVCNNGTKIFVMAK